MIQVEKAGVSEPLLKFHPPHPQKLFIDSDLNWIQQTQIWYTVPTNLQYITVVTVQYINLQYLYFLAPKMHGYPDHAQGVTHCRDVDANGLGLGQGGKAGALGLPRSFKKGMSSTLPTYCARVFLLGCFKYACFCFHHGSPTSLLSGQVIHDKSTWHEITKYVLVDLWMSYSKRVF